MLTRLRAASPAVEHARKTRHRKQVLQSATRLEPGQVKAPKTAKIKRPGQKAAQKLIKKQKKQIRKARKA